MTGHIAISTQLGAFALDAAFELPDSDVTALFGPSGAGKSTIVHAIAGLMMPAKGQITIGGETLLDTERNISVPARQRRLGVVFQDSRLFPHLSVRGNLLYGWRRAAAPCGADEVDRVTRLLGLENFLERKPRTLSGGERSRVALGRALLMGPRALLLDEPLTGLDATRKGEILPYLERIRDEEKLPILYVSHAIDEITRFADRIVVLNAGRVVAEGSLFDVTARLDLASGQAMFPGTILDATVAAHDRPFGLTELAIGGERLVVPAMTRNIGDKIRIRIDAQDVMLALSRPSDVSANNILPAIIEEMRAHDETAMDVKLRLGETRLLARVTRRSAERLGLAVEGDVFAIIKAVTVGGRDGA